MPSETRQLIAAIVTKTDEIGKAQRISLRLLFVLSVVCR